MADEKESCRLRLPEYEFWYRGILENDFRKLQEILEKSSKQHRHKLLNDPFELDTTEYDQLPLSKQISSHFKISYPLQLVAVAGHKESFDILVENGANVFIKDEYGNNILHLMCYFINSNTSVEDKIRAFYKHLFQKIPQNDMNLLLTQKNGLKWTPEVTAISLGVLGLFLDIFMSKGIIYLI